MHYAVEVSIKIKTISYISIQNSKHSSYDPHVSIDPRTHNRAISITSNVCVRLESKNISSCQPRPSCVHGVIHTCVLFLIAPSVVQLHQFTDSEQLYRFSKYCCRLSFQDSVANGKNGTYIGGSSSSLCLSILIYHRHFFETT